MSRPARRPSDPDGSSAPSGSQRSGSARRPWWRRKLVVAPVVVLLAVLLYGGGTFVQVWRASRVDGARPAEAIVVMGAAQYDGRPSPVLRNRLDHALDLYEQGFAPLIVVTGGRQEGDRFTEATSGYNYLRARGVPDDHIRKEVQGHTTYESLAATARFLRADGITDVILVSSPSHSKRLAGVADDVGLDAALSPSSGTSSLTSLGRETLAVSVGRLIGYRRMDAIGS